MLPTSSIMRPIEEFNFKGGNFVSNLTIITIIILGIFMLSFGLKSKRKWLVGISIISILVAMSQVIILLSMLFH